MSGRMLDVELVEPDGVGPGAAPPSAAPPGHPWLRRNARLLVAGGLSLAVVLVGTQAVVDARERARLAELAAIPGVLAPVDDSLEVRWRGDLEVSQVLQGGTVVDGTLVGVAETEPGSLELWGLDAGTGERRWATSAELATPLMTPDGGAPEAWTTCAPLDGLVACVAQQSGTAGVSPDMTVWVLDPADGRLLRTTRLPGEAGLTFSRGDVVSAVPVLLDGTTPAAAGAGTVRWAVTATNGRTGDVAWAYTTPPVDVVGREDGTTTYDSSTRSAALDARDDRVLLIVDHHAWELGTDGTLHRSVLLDDVSWVELTRAGGLVQSTYDGRGGRSALLRDDGTWVRTASVPLWLPVDDGSAAGLVFFAQQSEGGISRIEARDGRTGARVWQVSVRAMTALLLDDRLFVGTADGLQALDATTGGTLWTVDLDRSVDEMTTDGRSLVVRGLGLSAEGYAPSDGRALWRTDLLAKVSASLAWSGEQLVVSSRLPRLYVQLPDGSVAVLG
ncbi:outer membrane protein assembly factor BamB family protein [Cellulomonas chitinilytica]|nr:PQQ-binding-like beta-propeller repeat protein [Cellulomonas chitinilytica]